MEMSIDYTQSDLGLNPRDWKIKSLDHVCDVRDGTHESPKFVENGVPFVTSKNIVDGKLDLADIKYVTLSDAIEFDKRSKVNSGDILMSMIGTVGNALLVHDEPNFCIKNVALIKPKTIIGTYLIQLINSPYFQRILIDNLNGGIQKFVSLSALRNVKVLVPPPSEQTAIANALSDADALIGSLQKLIEKKRQIKQGAMQTLLNPYENGMLKTGWTESKLSDVLKIGHGRSQHEVICLNGEYPILASGGEIGRANKFLYDKPSVLIGRKGTIDVPQFMDKPFWTIDTLFYTEIFEPNNAKYMFYQFNLIDWYSYNEASGVPSLSARTIESIEIGLPDPDEQIRIATILSDMDAEIAALETKLAKYQQIKQGMMQNLLTGRIRLV